jgi:hypothetical protein
MAVIMTVVTTEAAIMVAVVTTTEHLFANWRL